MLRASELKSGTVVRNTWVEKDNPIADWHTVDEVVGVESDVFTVRFKDIKGEYFFRIRHSSDEAVWEVHENPPTILERLSDLEKKVNMIFNTINEHFPIHEPGVVIGGGPVEDRLYKASELKQGMIVRRTAGNWSWDRVIRVYGVNINTWRVIFAESAPHMFAPGKYDDDPIWEVQRA